MAIIKHVGKHNGRRIAIVYRTIPGEDHMALALYTDSLPSMIHDAAMRVLESAPGQQAKELADALFRETMADGRNCLEAIHRGGFMQKIPTNQIIVTASATNTIRLDELNKLLAQIESGATAEQELQSIKEGAKTAPVTEGRELGEAAGKTTAADTSGLNTSSDVLSDTALANQRTAQAEQFRAQAKGLLAEAARLEQEAKQLAPKRPYVRKSTAKKDTA